MAWHTFLCPKCYKEVSVPVEAVGKVAKCNLCGAAIAVPTREQDSSFRGNLKQRREAEAEHHRRQEETERIRKEKAEAEHIIMARERGREEAEHNRKMWEKMRFEEEERTRRAAEELTRRDEERRQAEAALDEKIKRWRVEHVTPQAETEEEPVAEPDVGVGVLPVLLFAFGLVWTFYFFSFYETSVYSSETSASVQNIGLLAHQQQGVNIGIGLMVVSAIFMVNRRIRGAIKKQGARPSAVENRAYARVAPTVAQRAGRAAGRIFRFNAPGLIPPAFSRLTFSVGWSS